MSMNRLVIIAFWNSLPNRAALLGHRSNINISGFFPQKGARSWLWYIRGYRMISSLSIVVPAYNEGARLGKSLRAIVAYLNEYASQSELIVVDDGSTDETADTARAELSDSQSVYTSVISYKSNLGKG